MASSIDIIMGSLFSVVAAGVIGLSFYGALSPTVLAVAIIAFLVIWYLARGADVDPPSTTSSRDNRTPSSPPPGDGPDLDGPTLGGGDGGGGNPGGGSSDDPEVRVKMEGKNNIPVEEGITSSEIMLKYEIHDKSGSGLDNMEIELENHGKTNIDLQGQENVISASPLNMLFGNFRLMEGTYNYRVEVKDGVPNTEVVDDFFQVSNKNGGGKNNGMPPSREEFATLRDEADYEENEVHDAMETIAKIHEKHRYQSELEEKILNDGESIIEDLENLSEHLNRLNNGNNVNMTPKEIRKTLQGDIHDLHTDVTSLKEHVNGEMSNEKTVEELMPHLEEVFEALSNEEERLENHLKKAMKQGGSGASSSHN